MKRKTQERIYADFKAKRLTKIGRHIYSIQYNPIAAVHTWIVRKDSEDSEWIWVQPLDPEIQ